MAIPPGRVVVEVEGTPRRLGFRHVLVLRPVTVNPVDVTAVVIGEETRRTAEDILLDPSTGITANRRVVDCIGFPL